MQFTVLRRMWDGNPSGGITKCARFRYSGKEGSTWLYSLQSSVMDRSWRRTPTPSPGCWPQRDPRNPGWTYLRSWEGRTAPDYWDQMSVFLFFFWFCFLFPFLFSLFPLFSFFLPFSFIVSCLISLILFLPCMSFLLYLSFFPLVFSSLFCSFFMCCLQLER